MQNQTNPRQTLLENGSSRANFDRLDEDELEDVVRRLTIARAQADTELVSFDDTYRSEMIEQRSRYFHRAASAGISYKEAKFIWWNFVWDNPAPCDRSALV